MNRLPLDVCVAALVHCNENVARHYIGARRIAQRCVIGPLFWLWSSNFPYESTCSLTFLNKRVRGSDSLFAAFKFQNGNIFWWITPIIESQSWPQRSSARSQTLNHWAEDGRSKIYIVWLVWKRVQATLTFMMCKTKWWPVQIHERPWELISLIKL